MRPSLLSVLAINLSIAGFIATLHAYVQRPAGTHAEMAPNSRGEARSALEMRPSVTLPLLPIGTHADRISGTQPPLSDEPLIRSGSSTRAFDDLRPSSVAAAAAVATPGAPGEMPGAGNPSGPSLLESGSGTLEASATSDSPSSTDEEVHGRTAVPLTLIARGVTPGNQLTVGQQNVTVTAVQSTEDAGEELLVEVTPAEQSGASATAPLQAKKARKPVAGFTPEEELFRTRWGWAAFDQARRAAAAAADHRTSEVGSPDAITTR